MWTVGGDSTYIPGPVDTDMNGQESEADAAQIILTY